MPLASLDEADAAIAEARAAAPAWAAVAPADRGLLLRRFSDLVGEHQEELAQLEVANAGHTIGNARWEAGNVRDVLAYYAAAPERNFGRQIPVAGGIDLTFREPIGVVGIIVPWNFPMPIAGWGLAPALAAGNTVVLKPAELTPLTALRLGQLALEAGLPEGVLTVVAGSGAVVGERFVTHPDVRKICFTGSTAVGQADHARRGRPGQAGHPRAGRQERQHRLRRLRPRGGCRTSSLRRLRQRRSGLLRSQPDPRRAQRLRPLPGALRDGGARRGRHRPARRGCRDGPTRSAPVTASGCGPTSRSRPSTSRWPSAVTGPTARATGIRPPSCCRARRPTGSGRRRSSARSWRSCPSTTRPTRSPRPTTRHTGSRGRSGPATSGAACGSRAASQAGNLSVNSHSSVRYSTPFGGFKQSGIGRELGPDALEAFTEVKNVFISTD